MRVVRSNRFVVSAALVAAVALCGCANNNFDTSGAWFSKPINALSSNAGYTYSNLSDTTKLERPVTATDLIDANGACPAAAGAAPPPQPQAATANSALSADMTSLLGGGVAIGMSECEVVGRLGRPAGINFGKNPNGFRSAVLTYNSGERPGVYRFEAGRLTEMDRVEEQQPPAPPPPKTAKKKPSKTDKPPKPHDAT